MKILRTVLISLIFAVICTALSGCYKITYKVADSARGPQYTAERWDQYFAFGLIPPQERSDLEQLCHGDTVQEIRSYRNPQNVVASVLGAGVTSASTVETTCARRG